MSYNDVFGIQNEENVDSALLSLISKLSLNNPDDALRLLALCAKDDLPNIEVLRYTLELIEGESDIKYN